MCACVGGGGGGGVVLKGILLVCECDDDALHAM